MDSFDIFRKLTLGAQFSKRKDSQKSKGSKNKIKKEENANFDLVLNDEDNYEQENKKVNIEDKDKYSFEILSRVKLEKKISKKRKRQTEEKDVDLKKKTKIENELNGLRNKYKIKVHGKNIPPPIRSFSELKDIYGVSDKIVNSLKSCGFSNPTPIQMQAIPMMLQGNSLLACAPTGSGKTVSFLVPVIHDLEKSKKNGFRAVILSPTRELARQILQECFYLTENSKLKCCEAKKNQRKYDILISTPKKVCYLLNQESSQLDLTNVEWFIIDEADKLMEEGINCFKVQIEQILNACPNPHKKIALFSATYAVQVSKWTLKNVKNLKRIIIGEYNSATHTVQQELLFVGSESGKLLAFRDLARTSLQPPVLVFVQTKERAKQLFQELIYDGINVDVIHSDRTQLQRNNVVKAFREGKIWVLICTELMSRGIDFKGVNLVINYDFPPTKISYIHRIGRSGRAGKIGKAITYFTQDDKVNLRSVAQLIKNSGGTVPDFMLTMKNPKKSDIKLLAKKPIEREEISTSLKFKHKQNKKIDKVDQNISTLKY